MSNEDKPRLEGPSNFKSYYDETGNDSPTLEIKPAGPGPLVSITQCRNANRNTSGLPTTKIRLKGIPTVGTADGTMQQTTKITIFGAGRRPDSIPSYSGTIKKCDGVSTFGQNQNVVFNRIRDEMECRNRCCYVVRPPCPHRPRRCPFLENPRTNIINNSDVNTQGVPSTHGLADGTVAYSQTVEKTVTDPVDSKHKQLHLERHVTSSPCGAILSDTLIGACLVDQQQQTPCIRLAASGSPCGQNSSCGQPAATSQSTLQAPQTRQAPQSRLQAPQSRLQAPQSRLQAPQSRLQAPQSRLQAPQSRQASPQSKCPAAQSRLQPPQSRLKPPQSRLQPPASRLAQPQVTKTKLQDLYSTIENSQSRLQQLGSKLQTPRSRLQPPQSRLQAPQSRLQPPQSRLQAPQSRLQTPQSRLQAPQSRLAQSRLQAPTSLQTSRTKLQAPCSSLQHSKTNLRRPKTPSPRLQQPCSSRSRLQTPSPTPGTSVSRVEEGQPCGASPRMQQTCASPERSRAEPYMASPRMQQTFASPERSREEPCMRVPSPKLQQSYTEEHSPRVQQPCLSPGMSKVRLDEAQPCMASPRMQQNYSSPERSREQEPCMRSPSPRLQQTYTEEQAQPCMAMQQTYASSPERSRAPSPRLQQPYLEEHQTELRMQTPSPRLQSPMRVRSPSPRLQQPCASPSSGTSRARLDESEPCMRVPSPRLQQPYLEEHQAQLRMQTPSPRLQSPMRVRSPSPRLQQPCASPNSGTSRARLDVSEPCMRVPSPRLQQAQMRQTPSPKLQQPYHSPAASRARLQESEAYMRPPSPRLQQPSQVRLEESQPCMMHQPQLSPRMQQPCPEGQRSPPRMRTPSPQLRMQPPSPRPQPCSTPGTSRSRLDESQPCMTAPSPRMQKPCPSPGMSRTRLQESSSSRQQQPCSSLPGSTSRLQEPCSRPSQSKLQAPRSRLQPPQAKRKTSPCTTSRPRSPSPCSSPKRSSGDVPHEKSIKVPTPISAKSSTTDVDLLNTSHIPVCPAHATLDEIKKLVEEEKQDVLQSQTLSPDLASKLKQLKKKSLLEETLQETIPTINVELCEGDEVSLPTPDSDVVANMMHSEERGVINTSSSPKKTYDALFGETCVTDETPTPECERSVAVSPAAPSPLNDIVVPVGEASQDDVAVVNPEIEYQVAQTDQEIPKADAYSEQQQGQLPASCAARRECIKQKKDGSFKGPQSPRRGELEAEKSPWDIDLDSLEDLVGGQVSMLSSDLPSDESIRTTLKRFEYVLDVEKPKHYSCVQLRGTQRPSWFPGYFFVHPENKNVSSNHDNENYVRLEQDPSKVFAQVWNIFKPNKLQANSEIVIL